MKTPKHGLLPQTTSTTPSTNNIVWQPSPFASTEKNECLSILEGLVKPKEIKTEETPVPPTAISSGKRPHSPIHEQTSKRHLHKQQTPVKENVDPNEDSFDYFDDDLDFADFLDNETIVTKPNQFLRFLVLEVYQRGYEKHLKVVDDISERLIILRDEWESTPVKIGDSINLLAVGIDGIIDRQKGMIVVNPDLLISATVVSDSFQCSRKSVLSERIKSGATNSAMTFGTLMHSLFQESLTTMDFSFDAMKSAALRLIRDNVKVLYCVGESDNSAERTMMAAIPEFQQFYKTYISNSGTCDTHRGTTASLQIESIVDIEENIWSPMFGLRGKVDVSVAVKGSSDCVVPLELKTGKNTSLFSHRAQSTLYTLLMKDRYKKEIDHSVLFYSKAGKTIKVPSIRAEVVGLMIGRNVLASYLSSNSRVKLPHVIKNENACKRCFVLETCAIHHAAMEQGTVESSGMGSVFDDLTRHLSPRQKTFFDKWINLIDMEEGDMLRYRKEIWTMGSRERQNLGRCLSNCGIIDITCASGSSLSAYLYTFESDKENTGLGTTSIVKGDPVVISVDDSDGYALAIGFVTLLDSKKVQVRLDRKIRTNNCDVNKVRFRIDKDELSSGMNLLRSNVVSIVSVEERRKAGLIIDLVQPKFGNDNFSPDEKLNADQNKALNKVLNAKDYALILGMPGTGKTTTIAAIVMALLKQNKTVLLASYTHSAVDTILLKLLSVKDHILRLGNSDKVHPAILPMTASKTSTIAQYKSMIESKKIVATTCLGITHPLFSKLLFDYCIIDEASQITLPVCLGPLRFANTFVLVGDHYQLPPLVRNSKAGKQGMACSLFKTLSEVHPEALMQLKTQYRMNQDIMTLANHLIYDFRLQCGTDAIASQQLSLNSKKFDGLDIWTQDILQPTRKLVFVNTDAIHAHEERKSDIIQNPSEAALVAHLVKSLVKCGLHQERIGVIAPYRAQVKLLEEYTQEFPSLEVLTVDRYQGRDKDCIFISFVRSNPEGKIGDLLQNWRRINVAITRAKKKLIMIGSRSTLLSCALFREMMEVMDKKQWVYLLPSGSFKVLTNK